jgi:kynurenine 3-monooxygenase
MPQSKSIILVGAGLSGSLLAIYLARRGFQVQVYERRGDMRKEKVEGGRSINMALSARGIAALQDVGLFGEIAPIMIPMFGRMIHPVSGSPALQPYGKDDSEHINSVSRATLNITLMDCAERQPGVQIHFNMRCTGIDLATGAAQFVNTSTGQQSEVHGATVIGTDGSASAIRRDMLVLRRFDYSQVNLQHAYKELVIPPATDGGFRFEKNALHIWPRQSFMMIALPNVDGSFTVTLFYPWDGPASFATLDTRERVLDFFTSTFPDAVAGMPTLLDDYFANPTSNLVTVKCFPWHVAAKAALVGDAAHAVVPFYGQGMNASFEDCTVLDRCVQEYGDDWERVFIAYESLRKENADAIADMAVDNFYEMRDRVADPVFQFRKKIEHLLEERFPARFIPKYAMVTFHHRIPYALAMKRAVIQEGILDELARGNITLGRIDLARAERLVMERLSEINEE